MSANSLLSICIPTYNRDYYLEKCLYILIPQLEEYKIPIYISDNSSTDNTIKILARIKRERYPFLYFKSNNENFGPEQNMVNAVEMSSSKYVWLLSDKSIVYPGVVDRINNILNNNDVDLLILNSNDREQIYKRVKNIRNKRYESAREVFIDLGWHVTLLGSFIIPRKAWDRDYKKYMGKALVHVGVIFDFLAGMDQVDVIFIEQPSIYALPAEQTWRNKTFQLWLIDWRDIIWSLPNIYSNNEKNHVIKLHNVNTEIFSPIYLFLLRMEQLYDLNVYNKYQRDLKKYSNGSMFLAKAISVLPSFFSKRCLKYLNLFIIRGYRVIGKVFKYLFSYSERKRIFSDY